MSESFHSNELMGRKKSVDNKKSWRISCRKWLWGAQIRFCIFTICCFPIIKVELDARPSIRLMLLWPFPGHTLLIVANIILLLSLHCLRFFPLAKFITVAFFSLINIRINRAEQKYKVSTVHHH